MNDFTPGASSRRETLRAAAHDLESRVRSGNPMSLESILGTYPQVVADKEAMLELVYTEYVLRQEMGHEVPVDEWIRRFPEWASDLRELFQVHDYLSATDLPDSHPPGSARQTFPGWEEPGERAHESQHRLGRFELLETIGRGGMGVVYRARQRGLDRIVALKTIHPFSESNEHILQRFRAEADTVARLHHPNIVPIYEVGIDDGLPYFAMEYIAGGSLSAVIRRHPLPPVVVARLMCSLAGAVQYAHEQGVVHRDLKPANVLLSPSDRPDAIELQLSTSTDDRRDELRRFEPKITDFGLAKRLDGDSPETLPGTALGTPSYMAPEQPAHGGARAGPAADVYSLGAIMYDALVGRPPFLAATPLETLERVKHDEPVSIRTAQPDVPRDLEVICFKCMHKDPLRRYRSAGELAADLKRFLTGRPIQARSASWLERVVKWSRRHPAAAVFICTLALAALAVLSQWFRAEWNRSLAEIQTQNANQARQVEQRERQRAQSTLYARDVTLAHFEFESNNTARAMQLLDGCPSEFRNWEWDYLQQICRQEIWDLPDLGNSVWCTAISGDGRLVAGGTGAWGVNRDERLMVWDTLTGELKWSLVGHPSSLMQLDFNPDGSLLASAGVHWQRELPRGGVRLWSMQSGTEVEVLPEINAFSVAFSPDGRWLAIGGEGGQVFLWDVEQKRMALTTRPHSQIVLDLAWNPTGTWLASCSRDGTVVVHDVSGNRIGSLSGLGDTRHVDFSPSGNELAIGSYSGLVRIYSCQREPWVEISRFSNPNVLGAMQYAPDGRSIVVASHFDSVRFVHPETGLVQRKLHGHNGVTRSVSFDRSGMLLATGGADGNVKVWDLTRPAQPQSARLPGGHMIAPCFLDNRRVAIAMGFNTDRGSLRFDGEMIRIWDTVSRKVVDHWSGHSDWLTDLAIDPSRSRLLTSSLDKTVCIWNAHNRQKLSEFGPFETIPRRVFFLDEGRLAGVLTDGGQVRIFPVPGVNAPGLNVSIESPVMSKGSESSATGGHSKHVMEWIFPLAPSAIVGAHQRKLWAAGGPAGELLLATLDDDDALTHIETGHNVRCLAISPDDRWLAVGCTSGAILLWRIQGPAESVALIPEQVIRAHSASIESLAFTPDGLRLISASLDTSLRMWDLRSGQQVLSLEGPLDDICHLVVDPQARTILMTNRTLVSQWVRDGIDRLSVSELQTDVDRCRQWYTEQLASAQAEQSHVAILFYADRLHELGSDDPRMLAARAAALAGMKRRLDAMYAFESVPIESRLMSDEFQLALLYLSQHEWDAYRQLCQRLAKKLPPLLTNANDINQIVWTTVLAADPGLSHTDLVPYVEMMLARGRSADALNTAGACYFRAGQYERAIETLSEAARLRSGAEVVFDQIFLALAYQRLGQTEYATSLLEEVQRWVESQHMLIKFGRPPHNIYHWISELELELLLDETTRAVRQ